MGTQDGKEKKEKAGIGNRVLTIIGIVLCALLVPLLIVNVTLIIKSYTSDGVPSFGGSIPQIVLSGSMEPTIKAGDLILSKTAEADEIKVGDVISFYDPAGNGNSVVTHRVIEIVDDGDGTYSWRTQGDGNGGVPDRLAVPFENLVGRWDGVRFPGLGSVALFMQTVPGIIVCVVVPFLLLVGYDFWRRRAYDKKEARHADELQAELDALRAAQANAQTPTGNADAAGKPDTPDAGTAAEPQEETAPQNRGE